MRVAVPISIRNERGDHRFQTGNKQLAAYLESEGVKEGYYIVFDHWEDPVPRIETETIAGQQIRSYVIPVMQAMPTELSDSTVQYRNVY